MATTIDDKKDSIKFFNAHIGAKGPVGWVSRYISNTGRWYTDMLIKEAEIKADDKVLDVGCGSASMLCELLKRINLNQKMCAIEPSDAQLALAKKAIEQNGFGDKVDLRQGFASPLPYDDDSFDVVYASFIIKHFTDETLSDFLKEALRVLKPGGRFAGWEFATVRGFFKRVASDPKNAFQKLRDFNDVNALLKTAGFSSIKEFEVRDRGFWDTVTDIGFKAVKGS